MYITNDGVNKRNDKNSLYEALVEFQKRKGLPADGRITEKVVKELRKRK